MKSTRQGLELDFSLIVSMIVVTAVLLLSCVFPIHGVFRVDVMTLSVQMRFGKRTS